MLGRGQLDAGDVSAVGLGEVDGVVAGAGADVQDAAPGDVSEDFGSGADPSQGTQGIWSGTDGV